MNDQPYLSPQADVPPPIMPEKPTVWPTVLGIIGILLGLYTLCTGAMGLFASGMMENMMRSNPAMQNLPEDYMASMKSLQTIGAAVGLPCAILLLAASILLLMRRAAARGLWMTWSVIYIVATLGITIYSWPMQRKMMDSIMASDPNMQNNAAASSIMNASTGVGAACGIIFAMALPIFALIWFNLAKIRREVEWWRQRRATPGGSM